MKKIIQIYLKFLAKLVLKKYRPEIIAITGSVGKTTTKEAIFSVLENKFNIRRSIKNYNNEIGVPLTIIDAESPGKNILGWFLISFKALKLLIFKDTNYPKVLILEMGIDRPGDMKYLMSIVRPDIGIITAIGDTHYEFFENKEGIAKEKGYLIEKTKKTGWSVLNFDSELVCALSKKSLAKVLTFGLKSSADIKAQEIKTSESGTSFTLSHNGQYAPVSISSALGAPVVYACLAAAAVGVAKSMRLMEISKNLNNFQTPKGRLNLIKGIKNTLIIDDTYNSSPQSAQAAIEILESVKIIKNNKKYIVLGDMLELGSLTESSHRALGESVVEAKIDKLITVGERAKDIVLGAKDAGMSDNNIFSFSNSKEAGKFIQDRIKTGDAILIKGSQGVRMEKITKEIMAEPLKASDLLVRQGREWD